MTKGLAEIRTSVVAVAVLASLLCVLYPAGVSLLARGLLPFRAAGSLVMRDGRVRGSLLLAQGFSGPQYFHPRPSAAGAGWDAVRSGGSNLGPLSRDLVERVRRRVGDYRSENGLADSTPVPADAVTASASGLDPDISLRNAELQAPRVARARGLAPGTVLALIGKEAEGRTFGLLGEPRVNVLKLNLALEAADDRR